jgi:molecular chaperone GrpE
MNTSEESKKVEQEEFNENAENQENNPLAEEGETLTEQEKELDKLKFEIADWKDKYLRLYADFDNFRKNKIKERAELIQTAGADVITGMLSVLDDFDRAMAANEQLTDPEALREGMRLIKHKLMHNLEAKGLKIMEAQGTAFDTDLHEAVTNIPAPEASLKGKVVDVLEKGYYLHDKVIRYAKVVVGQ